LTYVGEGLEDVVVARIDEIRAIEGADRVRLVVVDAGDGPLEIVCGAMNFALGNHVPLAPVGAVLPGGFEIAQRKMRGVTSNGMLCSARELGLGDDHRGLMMLDGLIDPRVGRVCSRLWYHSPTSVFDISVEGNRPDAWCVRGVARDLATRLGRTLRAPPLAEPNAATRATPSRGRYRRPRPVRATDRVGAAPRRRCVPRRRGWPARVRVPACARSPTWSTRPTS
jgi:phenylalanyl-tRNA synthetase beta chain